MMRDKIGSLNLREPLYVDAGTPVGRVVEQIQQDGAGCVVVVEASRVVGIMTERDVLMKVVARDVDYSEPVDKFMTQNPVTITPNDMLGDAVNLMNENKFRNLPVVDTGTSQPVGIISIKDIIAIVAESFPEQVLNLPPRPHQTMETPEGA
jgi:CBS domain-containing protein